MEHGEEIDGTDAPIHAAMRADEQLDAGDLDGAAVWRRIKAAIEEMQKQAPGEGDVGAGSRATSSS